MTDDCKMTAIYGRDWRSAATDDDLASAVARLESAVAMAREAGRPVTATAILHEARDIEAQRKKQLMDLAETSRDRVAYQANHPDNLVVDP